MNMLALLSHEFAQWPLLGVVAELLDDTRVEQRHDQSK
jgi:hypothetical protein